LRGTWGTLKWKPWREREERVFRRRVLVWKKTDIEERKERKECSRSSKCLKWSNSCKA
jgi:hypothetical protein